MLPFLERLACGYLSRKCPLASVAKELTASDDQLCVGFEKLKLDSSKSRAGSSEGVC